MAQLMPLPLTVSCFSKIQIIVYCLSPIVCAVLIPTMAVSNVVSVSPSKPLVLLVGCQEEHLVCKRLCDEVLVRLSVRSEVQIVCV